MNRLGVRNLECFFCWGR